MRGYLNYRELQRTMQAQERTSVFAGGASSDSFEDIDNGERTVYVTDASPKEVRIGNTLEINVTHEILHEGLPIVEAGDRWLDPATNKVYYVRFVRDPGLLNWWSVYVVEELDVEDEG